MKVLILNTTSFRIHGISEVIFNYYSELTKNKIDVDFVGSTPFDPKYKKKLNGISKVYLVKRKKRFLAYLFTLFKLKRDNNYDIIHIHGSSAMMFLDMIPFLLGKKVKIITHTHNTSNKHAFINSILGYFLNLFTNYRLAASDESGKLLYRSHDFFVLKNAIDVDKFSYNPTIRDRLRKKHNIFSSDDVFIHIGRFSEQKNQLWLINLFKKYSERDGHCKLLLVGEGPLLDKAKAKVETEKLTNIFFINPTPHISDYLSMADCLLLPSIFEAYPVVMVEAQSSGIKVIASNNITTKTNLTGEVKYISLESQSEWMREMKNTDKLKDRNIDAEIVKSIGYDIKYNGKTLVNIYTDLYHKN